MSTYSPKSMEGWGWPLLARKVHYFRGAKALCRRWMFGGALSSEDRGNFTAPGPDDCVVCFRKREKERAA